MTLFKLIKQSIVQIIDKSHLMFYRAGKQFKKIKFVFVFDNASWYQPGTFYLISLVKVKLSIYIQKR